MNRVALGLVVLASLFFVGEASGAVTLDFEGVPDQYNFDLGRMNLGSYYADLGAANGPVFSPGATILIPSLVPAFAGPYPARSGVGVLYSAGFPYIDVTFTTPVASVGFYYRAFAGLHITAFDDADGLVGDVLGPGNYNQPVTAADYLSLSSSAPNIKRIQIHDTGNYFVVDDFTYSQSPPSGGSDVPEPATLAIWLVLGSIAAGVAWSRKRALAR
jgi:hypothetical protein